jgi:branched-chain amino acid transport system permease protein
MTTFFNALVSGIALGGLYGLIALGYVIVYRSTHTLNFGQGAFLTLGAYLTYTLSGPLKGLNFDSPPSLLRLPYLVALVIATLLMAGLGWAVNKFVITGFRGRPVFAVIMVTLGVGVVVASIISGVWGTTATSLNSPFGDKFVRVGGVGLKYIDLFTLAVTASIGIAFFFGFQRSKLGTAMKATAFDQEAAIAQGISPNMIFGLSWALASALARGPDRRPPRCRRRSVFLRSSGSRPWCSAALILLKELFSVVSSSASSKK